MTTTWTVKYLNFNNEIRRTFVNAPVDATENDVIGLALGGEANYSTDCIKEVLEVFCY
jgi:hypothetical protein